MILCTKGHLVGHRLEAREHLCALVYVKELDALTELTGALYEDILDLTSRYGVRHEHREVTAYRRELRQRNVLGVIIDQRIHLRHIDDRDIRRLADRVVLENLRVNLTEVTDHMTIVDDICASARVQERLRTAGCIIVVAARETELVQDHLDITLHREEVALSDLAEGQRHTLIRKLRQRQRLRDVDGRHLIETCITIAAVIVRAEGCQHTVHAGRTHHREVLTERVQNLHLLTLHRIGREQELIIYLRGLEAVHEGLGIAERLCVVTYTLIDREVRCQTACHIPAGRKGHGDIRITVETENLLRDVTHAVDILTEGRRGHGQGVAIRTDLGRELDLLEVSLHLLCREVEADQVIDLGCLADHDRRLPLHRIDVDDPTDHLTGAELLDQGTCTIDGRLCEVRVEALLEVAGRIRTVADLTST